MFSAAVSKAVFVLYDTETKKWKTDKPLKVIINPSDITLATILKTQETKSTGEQKKEDTVKPDGPVRQTIKMLLHFDAVDLYEDAVTKRKKEDPSVLKTFFSSLKADGFMDAAKTTAGTLLTPKDYTDINVMSEKLCCLHDLQKAAIEKSMVAFVWGSLKYVGIFSDFSIRFTYFTNQGAPIRAEAHLSIECTPVPEPESETAMKSTESKLSAEAKRPDPDMM